MAYISFQPKDHFNTVTYTGNGSTQSITGVGFQPDWTWIKGRGSSNYDHQLFDAVRGVTKAIASNDTVGESTFSNSLTSFDSDGFSLGDFSRTNSNGDNKVSWNWKANGQGSANSDGSTASLYTSANTTSGFSMVTYTGNGANRTIGHGLGKAPDMILGKQYNGTRSWYVGATSIGWGSELYLNGSDGSTSSGSTFNSTAPTTSVISIGSGSALNSNGETFIAYCFADVQGFSRIGKQYVGNGNANGPFVYTGFKPAFVMIKREQSGEGWIMLDNKRSPSNAVIKQLFANLNQAEESVSTKAVDFLANGFKIRNTDGVLNTNGNSYTYMALAEESLVASNGDPATAR